MTTSAVLPAICFPMAGEPFGGSVVSTLILARSLAARGRRVVVAVHGDGPVLDVVRASGLDHSVLPSLGAALPGRSADSLRPGNLVRTPRLASYLRREAIGIVHVNDNRTLRTWPLPTRLVGACFVAHWRGNYAKSFSVDLGLRLADAVVAISRQNAEPLPVWTRRKTAVIYNPFDARPPATERQAMREKLGLPVDALVVGAFGSLIARKRPHLLFDIVERLGPIGERPVFGLLCGERLEPYDTELDRRLTDARLAARVVVPGHVDDVFGAMAACDLVLVPALDEPFGRTAVEAQSVGVPVIVSSGCGAREVIEDGVSGIVLPPDDLSAWVDNARRILADREFANRLAAGGRAVAAALSPEAHATRIENVYRVACAARRGQAVLSSPGLEAGRPKASEQDA